jgi:hypothetical protein
MTLTEKDYGNLRLLISNCNHHSGCDKKCSLNEQLTCWLRQQASEYEVEQK